MDEPEQIRAQIQKFVSGTFLIDFDNMAGPDTDLFDANFIDSFGFVELITFLEQTFGLTVSEEDIASPRMGTLAGMQSIVLEALQRVKQDG